MALETSFVTYWESIHGIAAAAADDITNGNALYWIQRLVSFIQLPLNSA